MKTAPVEHLDRIAEVIRAKGQREVSLSDVVSLAEVTVESLSTFFRAIDTGLYRELAAIAGYITTLRAEIGRLQPNDMKQSRIPSAGMELDAVVQATEKATDTIMGVAEELMAADASDPAAFKALVDEKMMILFEACSFQDLTGQRVAKVVETLRHIEQRVSRFAEAINVADEHGFASEEEQRREIRRAANIINGPALAGEGIEQIDVDQLFDKPSSKPSQGDIDALFG